MSTSRSTRYDLSGSHSRCNLAVASRREEPRHRPADARDLLHRPSVAANPAPFAVAEPRRRPIGLGVVPSGHDVDMAPGVIEGQGGLHTPRREEVERYYADFSLRVGLRDWLVPNLRHEQLKLLIGEIFAGRDGLEILDVGCGTGVMSHALTRYGHVSGIDISQPAIELARDLVPGGSFHAGRLGPGVLERRFDAITLFDVLEHVPSAELEGFLKTLGGRLNERGTIVASTPHPDFIRWLRSNRPDLLQVVDEPVELPVLLEHARSLGWELLRYETYDIEHGPGQYQLMVLTRARARGAGPSPTRALVRRGHVHRNPLGRVLRRLPVATRMLRSRGARWGAWTVAPWFKAPDDQ